MSDVHLSPRQGEIVELVGKGFSTKQTARELGISPKTVSEHLRRIAAKIPGDDTPMRKAFKLSLHRHAL